jgi:hypothetical protein
MKFPHLILIHLKTIICVNLAQIHTPMEATLQIISFWKDVKIKKQNKKKIIFARKKITKKSIDVHQSINSFIKKNYIMSKIFGSLKKI